MISRVQTALHFTVTYLNCGFGVLQKHEVALLLYGNSLVNSCYGILTYDAM